MLFPNSFRPRTHALAFVGGLLLLPLVAAASPPDTKKAPTLAARAAGLSRLLVGTQAVAPTLQPKPWYRQVRVSPFSRANGYGLTLKYRW